MLKYTTPDSTNSAHTCVLLPFTK